MSGRLRRARWSESARTDMWVCVEVRAVERCVNLVLLSVCVAVDVCRSCAVALYLHRHAAPPDRHCPRTIARARSPPPKRFLPPTMADFSSDEDGAVVLAAAGRAASSGDPPPALVDAARVGRDRCGDPCVVVILSGLCDSPHASGLAHLAAKAFFDGRVAQAGLPPAALPRRPCSAPLMAHGAAVARWRTLSSPPDAAPGTWAAVVLPAMAQGTDEVVAFVVYEFLKATALQTPFAIGVGHNVSVETPRDRWSAFVASVLGPLRTVSGCSLDEAMSAMREEFGIGAAILRHDVISTVGPAIAHGAWAADARPVVRGVVGAGRYGMHAAHHPSLLLWSSRAQSVYKPSRRALRALRDATRAATPWPTTVSDAAPPAAGSRVGRRPDSHDRDARTASESRPLPTHFSVASHRQRPCSGRDARQPPTQGGSRPSHGCVFGPNGARLR